MEVAILMIRSELQRTIRSMRTHRFGFVKVQKLRILCFIFLALTFLACASLPEPDPHMKTMTLAYEPHPDSRLAVLARNLTADLDEGTSGFLKLFRNDDALH